MSFCLLEPLTEYKIWVKAFTGKHEGLSSDPVIDTTDIGGPDPPMILNLTCQTQDTMYIKWKRPNNFFGSVDFYYLYIKLDNQIWSNITIPTQTKHLDTAVSVFNINWIKFQLKLRNNFLFTSILYFQFIVKNVTTDAVYKIQLQASTKSNRTGRIILGNISEHKSVFMQQNCEKLQEYLHTTHELSTGVLAGILCATLAFLFAISGFVMWRWVSLSFPWQTVSNAIFSQEMFPCILLLPGWSPLFSSNCATELELHTWWCFGI